MIETMTGRVGRIISGGLNTLINRLENAAPESIMKASIREIDSVIEEVRAELGAVVARKHLASSRLMEENSRHESLVPKIELAIAGERVDLARTAVGLQLDIEAQIPVLEATIAECAERIAEFEGYLIALQAKKREMKSEMRSVSEHRRSRGNTKANTFADVPTKAISEHRVAQAEAAFGRATESVGGLAHSDCPELRNTALLAELDDLARDNRISERLSSIKQRET